MADIDARIPLMGQPSPFNPAAAAQAGMQMQSERQLQQMRQQQIESFPQVQEARQQALETGRIGLENDRLMLAGRQRQVQGLQLWTQALHMFTPKDENGNPAGPANHKAVADFLTANNFPDFAEMDTDQWSKSVKANDDIQRGQLGLEQTNIAAILSELNNVTTAQDPDMYYQGVAAKLHQRFDADPAVGNFVSGLPLHNPGPDGLKSMFDKLYGRSAIIQRTLDPAGVGLKESETRKNTAEANYLENYGKLSGTEGEFMAKYAQQLGKSVKDMTVEEYSRGLGMYKAANADPTLRALLISAKTTQESNAAFERILSRMAMGTLGTTPQTVTLTEPGSKTPVTVTIDPNLHGEQFLQSLPAGLADTIRGYASGRRQAPAGFALKSPYFQNLMMLVQQADPTYDQSRFKYRQDFLSPNSRTGQAVGALNTAVAHLDELNEMAKALQNKDVRAYNGIANKVMTEFGWTGETNFDTVAPRLADEVERLWRGAGGTSGEIERTLKTSLSSTNSPDQMTGAVRETSRLIGGKLQSLEYQRDQALGPFAKDVQITSPQTKERLDRFTGAAAGQPQQRQSSPPTAALAGLPRHVPGQPWQGRQINEGPNAGEVWGVDENGAPKLLKSKGQ